MKFKIWSKDSQRTLLSEMPAINCSICNKSVSLDTGNDIYYDADDLEGGDLYCSECIIE